METITSLKAAVLPISTIEVDTGSEVKKYSLVMDFNAIAKAEELLKRDISQLASWKNMSASDVAIVFWCGLQRFHPEVTLEDVHNWLAPAQRWQVFNMLIEQCFPGFIKNIEDKIESGEIKVDGSTGESAPSVQAETASAGQ